LTKKYINWEKEVLPSITKTLNLYTYTEKIPLGIRGMYYILVSLNVFENLPARYNYLSTFTTRLRESGELPMDCFVDDVRYVTNVADRYLTTEQYLQRGIELIKYAKDEYRIPRWRNQPNYVEIWAEKGTMRAILNSIVNVTGKREVRIVPTGGQESVSFAWDNVKRLFRKQFEEGKKIHIRYFGDLDPAGEVIERCTYDKIWLEPYDLQNVDFKRVGVTNEQRLQFGLIPNTDPKTMAKLRNHPGRDAFIEKYGDLFQIEVDALQAIKPTEFKAIVLGCIDELFDEGIYKRAQKQLPKAREIVELADFETKDLCTYLQNQLSKKRIRRIPPK
jgi:hypothetical protein